MNLAIPLFVSILYISTVSSSFLKTSGYPQYGSGGNPYGYRPDYNPYSNYGYGYGGYGSTGYGSTGYGSTVINRPFYGFGTSGYGSSASYAYPQNNFGYFGGSGSSGYGSSLYPYNSGSGFNSGYNMNPYYNRPYSFSPFSSGYKS